MLLKFRVLYQQTSRVLKDIAIDSLSQFTVQDLNIESNLK